MQDKDLYAGLIRLHILYHCSKEQVYGAGMIEELRHHGYSLSPGTLYPMLHKMEKNGYLTSESTLVGGRIRKYYHCTPQGINALELAKGKVKELFGELFQ